MSKDRLEEFTLEELERELARRRSAQHNGPLRDFEVATEKAQRERTRALTHPTYRPSRSRERQLPPRQDRWRWITAAELGASTIDVQEPFNARPLFVSRRLPCGNLFAEYLDRGDAPGKALFVQHADLDLDHGHEQIGRAVSAVLVIHAGRRARSRWDRNARLTEKLKGPT